MLLGAVETVLGIFRFDKINPNDEASLGDSRPPPSPANEVVLF